MDYRGWALKRGTAYLKLQWVCNSCSSSEVTSNYNIKSMLKYYVEEVIEVIEIFNPEQELSLREFDNL